jgi:hypothetical protein
MRKAAAPDESSKSEYRKLCEIESSIPLFSRDWWLDAVCEDGDWGAVIARNGNTVNGALPYYVRKRRRMVLLTHPPLTQTLGPWIRDIESKDCTRLARQKKTMLELIDGLPAFDHFSQNWHPSETNWLPFYWRGFSQTTRYTYVISDLRHVDQLWSGLRENIRREIKKARNRFGLQVVADVDVSEFLELNRQTYRHQGLDLPYSEEVVHKIDEACGSRSCRKILTAIDDHGVKHAAAYVVWDAQRAYYLMGGATADSRGSGAGSLCLWAAIEHAREVTRAFDFEGSMLENIERYFRAFGATQTPYFTVSKTPSLQIRVRHALSKILGD